MAINPKLEFFRFKLNPKKGGFKTFRDFAFEELYAPKKATDEKIVEHISKYFVKNLSSEIAKDEKLKKKICFEKKKSINKYNDKGPNFDSANHTLFGVINGGAYGRERIVSDNDDEDDSSTLGVNKTVLMYFFFFAYLPPNHDEGFFMIHSNAKDESVTPIFRNYMTHLFKGTNYYKAIPEEFCPKSFQDEFKKGASLKKMTFNSTFVDDVHTTDGLSQLMQEYEIRIEATPKNKDIPGTAAVAFFNKFSKKIFGSKAKTRSLENFDRTTVVLESDVNNHTQKTFEWNAKDNDFVPVVYLRGRITKENADGTPDFDELKKFCTTIFKDEFLPEIRPDLNVTKAK